MRKLDKDWENNLLEVRDRKWEAIGLKPGFLRCVFHLHVAWLNQGSKTKDHYNWPKRERNLENKLKSKFETQIECGIILPHTPPLIPVVEFTRQFPFFPE